MNSQSSVRCVVIVKDEGGLHWEKSIKGWFLNVYFKVKMIGLTDGLDVACEGNRGNWTPAKKVVALNIVP